MEGDGTGFETINGGQTEVLGGVFNMGQPPYDYPATTVADSDISITASTNSWNDSHYFPIAVRETRGGETRELKHTVLPERFKPQYTIPLYVAYGSKP